MTKEEKRRQWWRDWYYNRGGKEWLSKWRKEHGFKKVVIKTDGK